MLAEPGSSLTGSGSLDAPATARGPGDPDGAGSAHPPIGRARPGLRRLVWVVVGCVGLAIVLYGVQRGLVDAQATLASLRAETGPRALVLLALLYAAALALPFVPGMELGLLIMVVFGSSGVVVAYAATLLGLSLSYAAGRMLPTRLMPWGARYRTTSPRDMIEALPAMLSAGRLGRHAPHRAVVWLTSHRYLALAVCLNLPGNAVVGGGGGIALLCGLSGQFGYRRYLLTIALAVSPLPILMLTGCAAWTPALSAGVAAFQP